MAGSPHELPITQHFQELADAIKQHQVVVIAGETGSGKTTQIPKICLAIGRGVTGMIGHTQPRRVAARAVASRIATELNSAVGEAVGYKVRFTDQVHEQSYIKLMTDGILLAEIQNDRYLNQYDTLIIDEAHERSLNIDFILGYLKQILPKRSDLKVIITSATIDPQRFADFFNNAPIFEIAGRSYPVEIRYRPLLAPTEDERDRNQIQAILDAVDEVSVLGQGDILIFLSGEREIRETAEALHKHPLAHSEILTLYARLSATEQNRIFQPHTGRRIILATNVAETSLTVPGIVFVIDTGLARVSRYSYRTKVHRLPIEAISQASAKQRAGRCGRTAPGICIRLYAEEDFQSRPLFTEPEILRTNLAAVILQMAALKLGRIDEFPFLEAPDSRYIRDGYRLLQEIRAFDEHDSLTFIGKQLAKLPLEPRLSKMLLTAKDEACLSEVLIIVSALSISDPRERPHDFQQKAAEKHARFNDERSDFIAFLKLWHDFHEQQQHLSHNKLRLYCKENFLSYVRMREWRDIHSQLLSVCHDLQWRENQQPADYNSIHCALLSGLLSNMAYKLEGIEYLGARNIKLHIFPGSGIYKKPPKWLVAAELVETTRLYARIVAAIEPEWVEKYAKHLVKKTYSEPHWEKRRGIVVAYEKTTLYGLILNPRKKIHYGPIDSQLSREIFIRSALVAGEYQTSAAFFKHNQALITEVEELENKARRRDLLIDEQLLFQFYDEKIPQGIYNDILFNQWRKDIEKNNPRFLFLTEEYLYRHKEHNVTAQLFPDYFDINGNQLTLTYCFEPGTSEDGVTLHVPLGLLNQLSTKQFSWMVPGLLKEKISALIKALPKSIRKNFVPIPEYAAACYERLTTSEHSLEEALAKCLQELSGITISSAAWKQQQLEPNLLMNFRIFDEQGETVGSGRDLEQLQKSLQARFSTNLKNLQQQQFDRDNIRLWDFGDLPKQVEYFQNNLPIIAYPAIVDQHDTVALRLFNNLPQAKSAMIRGLCRLFILTAQQPFKYIKKQTPQLPQICLLYTVLGSNQELLDDFLMAVANQVFLNEQPLIYTVAEFNQRLEQGKSHIVSQGNELAKIIYNILIEYHAVLKQFNAVKIAYAEISNDINNQLSQLIYKGFITHTSMTWLRRIPVYLKALQIRLTKLRGGLEKDRELSKELLLTWNKYQVYLQQHAGDMEFEHYRWMLEEYRISLYAQELKTIFPISKKRLEQHWQAITANA